MTGSRSPRTCAAGKPPGWSQCSDVLWYQVRKDALVRLVIVRDPSGIEPDDFFVTTDLSATGAQTATRYAGRWPIECCFKEVKQHAGLHTAVWCCYLASWDGKPTWRVRPWYTRKATPSFLDALAALRRDLWHQRITGMSSSAPLPGKILGPLLDTLAEAA